MSRCRDADFRIGRLIGGASFYPYQLALGLSVRYWPRIFAPSLRVHIGPFKVWLAWLGRAVQTPLEVMP
jgi:hypothetical protein